MKSHILQGESKDPFLSWEAFHVTVLQQNLRIISPENVSACNCAHFWHCKKSSKRSWVEAEKRRTV